MSYSSQVPYISINPMWHISKYVINDASFQAYYTKCRHCWWFLLCNGTTVTGNVGLQGRGYEQADKGTDIKMSIINYIVILNKKWPSSAHNQS